MNIYLIAPDLESRFHKSPEGFKIPYPIMFSTSGLQLLAALTPANHTIKVVDETIGEKVDYDYSADLVGITAMTTQSPRAYAIADEFSRRGKKVVMGGFHPSARPDEALEHCDAVCVGEGELVWKQLLVDAENDSLQPVYQGDRLVDFSEVPWPDRSVVRDKKGMLKNFIQTTRGCPFHCSFCTVIKFFGETYRLRPVADIVNEIRALKESGQLKWNFVFFSDDNIAGNPRYAKELFRALIPLKIRWGSQCSISAAKDEELLSLARQSGCKALAIGLESVSESSLIAANKNMGKAADYHKAIAAIHKHKIAVFGLFIFGFDCDDESVFADTLAFIEQNHLEYAMFSILTPLPGTSFYTEFKREGRLLHEDWAKYDFQTVVFEPKHMTARTLQLGRYTSAKSIHSYSSIFKRIFGAKTNVVFPLLFNLSLRKLYRRLPSGL
ncbi:MAG: B12-binding domain-containing radical SAM protein [Propionibacteriaceae bacterium]|nr:B12-binding domain-containing radical SAM protein [Propionibacteriaceae bacterium]